MTQTYKCADCHLIFDKRSQRDNHKRMDHQVGAKVTDVHGEEWEVIRQDGVYHCPVGSCSYQNENPKNLNLHMKECKGGNGARVAPVSVDVPGVRVVPFGTHIIGAFHPAQSPITA
ncbi:hypothetical protein DFH28DRAFT_918682 [Melampsora americana]|nr:hypothetical protein DFH28DRAFT_918682 [Melampsora americana]